jgi:chemotaxis protein methyltransferase CheR
MKTAALLADPAFERLRNWVVEHTGLGYYSDKDNDFASRILRRLAARGATDGGEYLALLQDPAAGPAEMDALVGELTIGETYFFRQRDHFAALGQVILPDLLERNRETRRLRIWSAGCATGAEPYSVAMLLRREFSERLADWDVSILGTDINREFLARAREGRFGRWALRETPEEVKAACFVREGKEWLLGPEYRGLVTFQQHNLMSEQLPLTGTAIFDLILCRNVMIYFGAETMRATVARLFDCLAAGGWLLVGHAEPNAEQFRAFRTVLFKSGVTLYQKPASGKTVSVQGAPAPPAAEPPEPAQPPAPWRANARTVAKTTRPRPAEPSVARARQMADRGEWDAAAAQCRKLIEADRLNAAAHFTLGLILEHAGSKEEAERSLRRSIYLDRGFLLAHYHLAVLLQRSGASADARRTFARVLELAAKQPPEKPLEGGDGITAGELAESARLHLSLLEAL